MMVPARRSGARATTAADDEVLSAMVIVRAASGTPLAGSAAIDSGTIARHAASPADVEATQHAFGEVGFTIGPHVGISFSISAPRSVFEKALRVRLAIGARGTVHVNADGVDHGLEVPVERLPASLRRHVEAVTFMPPTSLHDGDEPATMV